MFAIRGYDGTSVRELCHLAGASRPVLYYHFGSKEGLFEAVMQRTWRHVEQRVLAALNGQCAFRDKCHALVSVLFQDAVEQPRMWLLMLSTLWSPAAAMRRNVATPSTSLLRQLEAEARQAAAAGEVHLGSPDATLVHVLVGTVTSMIASFLRTGSPLLTPTAAEAVVTAVFDGFARKPPGNL